MLTFYEKSIEFVKKRALVSALFFKKRALVNALFLTEKCNFFHVWRIRDQGIPGYMDISVLSFKILQWRLA